METIINPEYLELFERGTLREKFVRAKPFEHAVLPNFFTEAFLARVKQHAAGIPLEASPGYGEAARADMGWGAYADARTLSEIFGLSFRAVMSSLLGRGVTMSARSIPQYFRYAPGSGGMTVHNDDKEANGRQIVSLLQLSEGYRPGLGGELLLHEGKENGHKVAVTVPPVSNTFIVFLVSAESWHSVADMRGSWRRELVSFDWYFKCENQ
jgi:hypothetical protein